MSVLIEAEDVLVGQPAGQAVAVRLTIAPSEWFMDPDGAHEDLEVRIEFPDVPESLVQRGNVILVRDRLNFVVAKAVSEFVPGTPENEIYDFADEGQMVGLDSDEDVEVHSLVTGLEVPVVRRLNALSSHELMKLAYDPRVILLRLP